MIVGGLWWRGGRVFESRQRHNYGVFFRQRQRLWIHAVLRSYNGHICKSACTNTKITENAASQFNYPLLTVVACFMHVCIRKCFPSVSRFVSNTTQRHQWFNLGSPGDISMLRCFPVGSERGVSFSGSDSSGAESAWQPKTLISDNHSTPSQRWPRSVRQTEKPLKNTSWCHRQCSNTDWLTSWLTSTRQALLLK